MIFPRLERMWQAYQQGQNNKKEVLIKTSTGEFRFEGISQTFTKRLYEWEERRGIRPESSTIALLAPELSRSEGGATREPGAAPEAPKTPEITRIARWVEDYELHHQDSESFLCTVLTTCVKL